ncbi:hypothetical protein [Flammeovirga sp. EKP202]|uniref:LIC11966 family surface protein n=1 Tax=Flammeovirga sp. EKP202 TaxID=2770592 RepID=UPI00165FE965|nr:hypothetical protein [Flammeovirga sp. EKP202]MBD0400460.1 hypothetical protein [Flammeovirga sp. EKP202]
MCFKTTIIAGIMSFLSLCAYSQETAGEYMSKIGEQYHQINEDTWDYIKKASRGRNASTIEKKRQALIGSLQSSRAQIKKLPPYDGDATLRDVFYESLSLSYHIMNSDYQKVVDMEKVAEMSYDEMEAYLLLKERIRARKDSMHNVVSTVQETFAENNNITLQESQSRLSRKLDNASEVNRYHNQLYLIHYKCHWYDKKVVKAKKAKDNEAAKKNIALLELAVNDGRDKLKNIEAFRGDESYKAACEELLTCYYKLATEYYPKQIEIQEQMTNFNKVVENFNAIKQKNRTQEDIDLYNSEVQRYNNNVNEYNTLVESSNKNRSNGTEKFNKVADKFQSKYI